MINFRMTIFLAVLLVCACACMGQKVTKDSFIFENKKRTYFLYVPEGAGAGPAPLVVLLHGSNHDGLSLVDKWKKLADAENFILLGPNSIDSANWSVPKDGPNALHELIESIRSKYSIDPHRIYLFGHSGGAVFALLMSLYESEYFAATAIHAGALDARGLDIISIAKRKTPIYVQVGTVDPLFPLFDVRRTRDALRAQGFPVELTEIPGHDHWYYDLAPKINDAAWKFLKSHTLESEPHFEAYAFKSSEQRSTSASDNYNKGVRLQQAGNFSGAIDAYTAAIHVQPSADAFNNRGVAHLVLKNYDAAVADFSDAIKLSPSPEAYNNRGNIYFSQKRFTEAIADFSESIKLKPSPEALTNRGTAYEETGEDTRALVDLEEAIRLNGKFARAYAVRGIVELKLHQEAAAQKDFEKAFQLEPALRAEFDPIINQLRSKPN